MTMDLNDALKYADGVRKNYEGTDFDDLPYGVQALLILGLTVNDLQDKITDQATVWQDGHSWGWNDRAVLASHPDHVDHRNPFEEES